MASSNFERCVEYHLEAGDSSHVDDSEFEPLNNRNDYPPRNPQHPSNALLYSPLSPPAFHDPSQLSSRQHPQPHQMHHYYGGSSNPPVFMPTPATMASPLNFPHNNQSSSPFYQYPFYPSGDQPGQHSDYQIPTSSNPPYSVQYPNYVPSYPYTPLPVAARTYGPTTQAAHTPSLTDIPSAANQEIHPPESMTDTSTPSGSGQRRVLRGTTTEMQPIRTRFIHEVPGMERPRSTPNVSNRANSQLMTPNSPPISLTSPSTPDSHPSIVVSFSQDQLPSLSHTMMEDKSLSQEELQRIFPPSARINVPSLSGSIQNSKWVCQWEDCNERVRSQDRTAHALEHYGKKRYTCSCGHTFARSQDKKRHLREQALCEVCQLRPVGRNGKEGRCPSCRSGNHLGR